jgi:hypothetical protein
MCFLLQASIYDIFRKYKLVSMRDCIQGVVDVSSSPSKNEHLQIQMRPSVKSTVTFTKLYMESWKVIREDEYNICRTRLQLFGYITG